MFQSAKQLVDKIKALRCIVSEKLELGVELSASTATTTAAISVSTPVTVLSSTGSAGVRTLADGYPGQIKVIFMMTDGGDIVVTPTNLYNGNTITFGEINDAWWGIFYAGSWHTIGGTAAVSVLG
jgi:hypothetical protein